MIKENLNGEVIQKTIDILKSIKDPEKCKMKRFTHDNSYIFNCGTASCIAGWMMAANQKEDFDPYGPNIEICLENLFLRKPRDHCHFYVPITRQLFYMSEVSSDTLHELFLRKKVIYEDHAAREAQCGDLVTEVFDLLPAPIRRQAMVNVLEGLLATGTVDWLPAIEQAIDAHVVT